MKICYINFTTTNSRDRVTIRGLRENGVEVIEVTDTTPGWRKFPSIRRKLKKIENYDQIIVGYTAAIFVPWMWLITRKKITYNALASFYESMIVSRRAGSSFSWKAFTYWGMDWCAFKTADLILVESQSQKHYIAKTFRIRPEKIEVHLSGVDDTIFYFDPHIQKSSKFIVLFRGKFLPEAGVDVLLHAAKKLEHLPVRFRILGHGLLQKEIVSLAQKLELKNTEIITDYLTDENIRAMMLECSLSLGQLAHHPRLLRTIPFKAFEAMAMKLPFLTARNKAVMEIHTENVTCLGCEPGDADDLARKIRFAYENPTLLETLRSNGYTLFQEHLTARSLGQNLLILLSKKTS